MDLVFYNNTFSYWSSQCLKIEQILINFILWFIISFSQRVWLYGVCQSQGSQQAYSTGTNSHSMVINHPSSQFNFQLLKIIKIIVQ